MKIKFFFLVFLTPLILLSQEEILSMNDVESKQEVSMNDAIGKSEDGIYRYYAKGETEPFTGILYANYSNGQVASWQQYIEGIGEGEWINYYDNGNFREVGNYESNRVTGPIKKYYKNGNLQAEGTYKDWRVRIGEWKCYNEKGNLVRTEDYGSKGSIVEVQEYYDRGDIPFSWYSQILKDNGFENTESRGK